MEQFIRGSRPWLPPRWRLPTSSRERPMHRRVHRAQHRTDKRAQQLQRQHISPSGPQARDARALAEAWVAGWLAAAAAGSFLNEALQTLEPAGVEACIRDFLIIDRVTCFVAVHGICTNAASRGPRSRCRPPFSSTREAADTRRVEDCTAKHTRASHSVTLSEAKGDSLAQENG